MPQPSRRTASPTREKLRREEGRLDWRRPASELERRVRAFDPWPGAFFEYRGERIRVLGAAALGGEPGQRRAPCSTTGLSIACGDRRAAAAAVAAAGARPLDAAAFLRGFPIPPGTLLPCPATS